MAYQVPISSIPLLQDPPFVIALALLAGAIGRRTLRVMRAPLETISTLESGLLSIGIGLGWLQYVVLGLGALSLLTPMAVRISLLILVLLFARDILDFLRMIRDAWSRRRAPDLWTIVCMALLTLTLTVSLLQALSPCTDADGLGYHLRTPKMWLQWRTVGALPTVPMTNFPMGLEMVYTLAMATWSDTAAKLIHYLCGVLALVGVYALGRRLRNPAVGLAAAGLLTLSGTYGPMNLFGYAYIEMGLTFELLCAVLAWTLWRQSRARGWLFCTALCAGFVVSFKQTGIVFMAGIGLIILSDLRREGKSGADGLRLALPWFALALLPVLPQVLRTWALTGNPFFPMFANLIPTRDWGPEMSRAFTLYHRYYNWAEHYRNWGQSLRTVILFGFAAVAAATGGLLYWRWRDPLTRPLLLFAVCLTVLLLLLTGPYMRFFLPLYPLYALLLFAAFPDRLTAAAGFRGAILAIILLNGLVFIRRANPSFGTGLRVATGRMSREEYLQSQIPPMPVWNYANRNLTDDDRIAVAGYGDVYYCDRFCYILKAYYEQIIRLDRWDHLVEDLRRQRINYLVIFTGGDEPPLGPDTEAVRNENPLTRRLAHEYGTLLVRAGGMDLYRLRDLPTSAPEPSNP